jgi:hypothetical protein
VKLKEALEHVKDEVVQDAAVVAALVLYKTLINNAGAYGEWAELYKWARDLVERQEFTVAAGKIRELREAHRRLEEVAEEMRRELNAVLALYALHSRDLYEKLRPHLEVDIEKAEGLAEAGYRRFSDYSDVNMGTKAYAALLSVARGGSYGNVAILLAGEGALADVVLLAPVTAYERARGIAKRRGEAVDPSHVGAAGWEDRATSVLLRYFLGRAVSEDLMFRRVEGGFEVFRAYGGVETRIDVLKIVKSAALSKAGKEVLRRFVEEAKRMVPDLSGIKKIWHALPWFATDASFRRKQIVAGTAHTWQAAWYIALFGEPKSISGRANVTEEGIKPFVTMYWPRERLDHIIAAESNELEPLLGTAQEVSQKHGGGRTVKSWRELVYAIDWRRVLEKVEELVVELKPWIGPEGASDAEREGLVRRMLGELALITHFAETRKGMDDRKWREERAKRLADAVEALSGGRIKDEYADRLAKLIIYYAEGYKQYAKKYINSLAGTLASVLKEDEERVRGKIWGIVNFILSDMYCLARDCARDEVVRKFVEPALELMMLDKALRDEYNRERARLIFGVMYATAVAGDGSVESDRVRLAVGGELGGGAALLRLAALYLLNQLLTDELKFDIRTYVSEGVYNITATGENAAGFKRLLAVSAPSAGGEYLSEKFEEFVEEAKVEVRVDNIRRTDGGYVAADLTISEAGIDVKYNVYLSDKIELEFQSTDRSRVELAAHLLKLAGVGAEVKKVGDRDEWRVEVTTDKLAAGRKELRDAVRKVVEEALKEGWVDAGKAEGWLEKLEKGRVLKEGWPKYEVGLIEGALVVRFGSTDPVSIQREVQRLSDMGLEEDRHFAVKMPEGGRKGYVSILRKGLERAARLSVHGSGKQQKLAAGLVEHILRRAEEEGEEVYRKALEVVEEGRARGSLTLKRFAKRVEVEGREHTVKVLGWSAVLEESESGKLLLRIKITAEVDGVRSDYTITYGRYGRDNAAMGRAYVSSGAPDDRRADAERFSALIKALTGKEPRIIERSNGAIELVCGREHLNGFARYAELADAIERWLEETSR